MTRGTREKALLSIGTVALLLAMSMLMTEAPSTLPSLASRTCSGRNSPVERIACSMASQLSLEIEHFRDQRKDEALATRRPITSHASLATPAGSA